ncbi:MAG: hypothetical protein KAH56_01880 [Candidatus Krumholzibacteria bacterium]|nr:hypothetical protein [Candidatus Krumholzibacteria bacterium]
MSTSRNRVDFDSGAVQSYLSILQGVINRMASNCAGCKTWCITLVSAIIVIIADKSNPTYVWVALVPVTLFVFLDSYYLGLEQRFRDSYNEFIEKIHSGTAEIGDVYIVNPGNGFLATFGSTLGAAKSLSVWPFYALLVVMLVVIYKYVL